MTADAQVAAVLYGINFGHGAIPQAVKRAAGFSDVITVEGGGRLSLQGVTDSHVRAEMLRIVASNGIRKVVVKVGRAGWIGIYTT